jgi:ketosteroid isomerase-like protein
MSQDNVELVREAVDALNRRDLASFLALMDEDVEVGSRQVAIEGEYHGHDGLRRWWSDVFDAFPDYTVEVEEARDLGGITLVHLHARSHSAHSDAPFADRFWQTSEWRHRKCMSWRIFSTEREALEAAGPQD